MQAGHTVRPQRMWAVAAVLLLCAAACPAFAQGPTSSRTGQRGEHQRASVHTTESPRLVPDVEQAIRWLPEDTETIIFAQGPVQNGVLRDFRGPPPAPAISAASPTPPRAEGTVPTGPPTWSPSPEPPEAKDFRQAMLTGSTVLFGLGGQAFSENITKHRIRFTVAAARRFGLPAIGRASTYEGCELIVFDGPIADVGMQARPGDRLAVELMEKNRVVRLDSDFVWGDKDDKLSIWYAKPKANILIAATNASFLKSMLQRMASPPSNRSPVLDFPEWKHVDTQTPVWGLRHRRTAMPIYILAPASKDGFPFAELSGISFLYQPQPANVTVRLHFPKTVEASLPGAVAKDPRAKLVSPRVVELAMPISRQPNGNQSAEPQSVCFSIHHYMGYTVCP